LSIKLCVGGVINPAVHVSSVTLLRAWACANPRCATIRGRPDGGAANQDALSSKSATSAPTMVITTHRHFHDLHMAVSIQVMSSDW